MDLKGIAAYIKAARDTAPDQAAARAPEFYPAFEDVVGTYQKKGARVRYTVNDQIVLYKLTCDDQTEEGTLIIETWNPVDAASIWTALDIEHEGTIDDPVPWAKGMECINGKYYSWEDVIYKCIRDSGIPLSYSPDQLIGHYFEIIN